MRKLNYHISLLLASLAFLSVLVQANTGQEDREESGLIKESCSIVQGKEAPIALAKKSPKKVQRLSPSEGTPEGEEGMGYREEPSLNVESQNGRIEKLATDISALRDIIISLCNKVDNMNEPAQFANFIGPFLTDYRNLLEKLVTQSKELVEHSAHEYETVTRNFLGKLTGTINGLKEENRRLSSEVSSLRQDFFNLRHEIAMLRQEVTRPK